MVKAAIAYWHVARGERAVFDEHWTPRMGALRASIKRACIHVSVEKSPLLLGDVRELRRRAETSNVRHRQAAGNSDLPSSGSLRGALLDDALVLRCVASASLAFFGVRRASETAALRLTDVVANVPNGVIELKVGCQKKGRLGVGQIAHVAALPSWMGRLSGAPDVGLFVVQNVADALPRSRKSDVYSRLVCSVVCRSGASPFRSRHGAVGLARLGKRVRR